VFAFLLMVLIVACSSTQVSAAGWHFNAEERRDMGVPAHKRMLAYYGRRLKSKTAAKSGLRNMNKGAAANAEDPWAELL
jgi:hypothetical protein